MILLFGSKASKSTLASSKNSNINNHPVENSGILAMSLNEAKSTMTMGEYDSYVSSNPVAVDYSVYSDFSDYSGTSEGGFMSGFSAAVATLSDGGFSSGSYSCGSGSVSSFSGCSSSGSSGSFASFC